MLPSILKSPLDIVFFASVRPTEILFQVNVLTVATATGLLGIVCVTSMILFLRIIPNVFPVSDITKPTAIDFPSAFLGSSLGGMALKNISIGIAYVKSTFNNTIISIADVHGNVIAWSSAGKKGFKGSRKSTPYAAQIAADEVGTKALEYGMKILSVEVKGPGSGRETALRSLQAKGFKITSIKDTTPMPHNGSRPPKRRRV